MQNLLQNPIFTSLLITIAIIGLFPLAAGYIVLVERKLLADFQVRLGPMRAGPHGIIQPLADALKLIIKEDVIPAQSDRWIFWMAPCISTFTALTAFCVVPFTPLIRVADVNVGLLVIAAMSSVGVLGIVLGSWASNSHYSLLGSLRSGAQLISYEVAISFALLAGVMAAGTLSMEGIVQAQAQRHLWFVFDNWGLMILPFFVYLVSAVAETNRAPFDLPEAESELVAGFMTEYSGFRWALYFLAEYGNICIISSVAVTLFWGGWLRPFPSVAWLDYPLNYAFPAALLIGSGLACLPLARKLPNRPRAIFLVFLAGCLVLLGLPFLVPAFNPYIAPFFWFFLKVAVIIYSMIWFRATWPRLRYDQLMNIGWRRLIPLGMAAVMVNAAVGMLR